MLGALCPSRARRPAPRGASAALTRPPTPASSTVSPRAGSRPSWRNRRICTGAVSVAATDPGPDPGRDSGPGRAQGTACRALGVVRVRLVVCRRAPGYRCRPRVTYARPNGRAQLQVGSRRTAKGARGRFSFGSRGYRSASLVAWGVVPRNALGRRRAAGHRVRHREDPFSRARDSAPVAPEGRLAPQTVPQRRASPGCISQ